MSIHKEALAEAKILKEVAEENAKKAILEEITPRVKKMIENQLLGESSDDDDEDDIMYDSHKKEDQVEESSNLKNSDSDHIELTQEHLETLAKLASTNSELHGVKALKIAQKLEEIHSKKLEENLYVEKLRQLKYEVEKTYKGLMEDKNKGLISDGSIKVIEEKLEEINETIVNLYVPSKLKLESRRYNSLLKLYNLHNSILKGYGLTEGANKVFGKKCSSLFRNGLGLLGSLAELKNIVENSKVDRAYKKVNDLVREIYNMSKKTLNEEELKLIIKGLDPQDIEGSALSVDVEPADEEEAMDDMDMDMGDEDLGGEDDLDLEMDMPMETELDEFGKSFGSLGSFKSGYNSAKMRDIGDRRSKLPQSKPGPAPAEDPGADEELGPEDTQVMRKTKKIGEGLDEEIEISEEMLTQELRKLKHRRAARKLREEKMKSMQAGNGPGEDLSDFGGGSKDGELFVDGEDLNSMDPVGTGFTVKEGEELTEDELNEFGSTFGSRGSSRSAWNAAKMASIGRERDAAKKKEEKEKAEKETQQEGELTEDELNEFGATFGSRGTSRSAWNAAKMRGIGDRRDAEKAKAEKAEKEKSEKASQNEGAIRVLRAYKKTNLKLKEQNEQLKNALRDANLFNAKLVYANRLLQNENLKPKQRLTVIESLDECETVKEVKQMYARMSKALGGEDKNEQLTEGREGRKIIGGSSKATKPGFSLNESEQKEFTRWGELAGVLNEQNNK